MRILTKENVQRVAGMLLDSYETHTGTTNSYTIRVSEFEHYCSLFEPRLSIEVFEKALLKFQKEKLIDSLRFNYSDDGPTDDMWRCGDDDPWIFAFDLSPSSIATITTLTSGSDDVDKTSSLIRVTDFGQYVRVFLDEGRYQDFKGLRGRLLAWFYSKRSSEGWYDYAAIRTGIKKENKSSVLGDAIDAINNLTKLELIESRPKKGNPLGHKEYKRK